MKAAKIVFSLLLPAGLIGSAPAALAMPRVCEQYQVSSQICFQAGLACMGSGSCIEATLKRYTQRAQRKPARKQAR